MTTIAVVAFIVIIFIIVPALMNQGSVKSSFFNPLDFLSAQATTLLLLATALNESLSATAYVVDYRAHQKKKDEFQDKQSFWAVIPQRSRPPAL